MKKYTTEIDRFIRRYAESLTCREMVEKLKEELGFEVTYESIKTYYTKHHIHPISRTGRKYPERRITSPEMDHFILEHFKGTGPTEMASMVNETFGTSFTARQMNNYYKRNHLRSGLTGQFEKGWSTFNKGMTWDDYMTPEGMENSRKTQFRKGHIPHNGGAPVGELRERRDKTGRVYFYEKVAQPNVWRQKHIVEWEKHHGKIPIGSIVTFCDGDSTNWNIENLILTTRAQHAVKNQFHIRSYDRSSAEVANTIADLKIAARKRRRKNEKTR